MMSKLSMMERTAGKVPAGVDRLPLTPTGWAAAQPADADLRWRPAPDPTDGSMTQDPDFSLPTTAGVLTWRLFYNTAAAGTNSEWGYGRQASFPLRLMSDGTTVTVMHETGLDRQYLYSGGSYIPQGPPTGDTLTQLWDGSWTETRFDTGIAYHYPPGNYVSLSYWATPQGMAITCIYDGTQRLQYLLEPAGNRLTVSYTGNQITSVQDWGNRFNTLTYDQNTGDLLSVQGPTGCVTTFGYLAPSTHLLQTIIDPMGVTTTYSYDYANRVQTRSVAGNMGVYTYINSGNNTLNTVYTDPMGHVWTHLSSNGYPTGQIDPLGNCETYVYANDRPQAFTDALGNTTTFIFDPGTGLQTGQIDPLGHQVTWTRDASGNVTQQINPTGSIFTYNYGPTPAQRQLQTRMDPVGMVTTYGYLANGLPQCVVDPTGACTTLVWSPQALKTVEMNPVGSCWTHQYDVVGNRTVQINPIGQCWTYGYDSNSRLCSICDPLGNVQTTVYDSRGWVQTKIDQAGRCTTYTWNCYGQQTVLQDPTGACWTTQYDAKGRPQVAMNPSGQCVTTNYDNADRPVFRVDMLGRTTTSVWDAVGRKIAIVVPDGTRTSTTFDAAGRPIVAIAPTNLLTTTTFDAANRPIAVQAPTGLVGTTIYDVMGRVSATMAPTGALTTTVYDNVGRVSAVVNALGFPTTTVYNASGLPIAQINPLGFVVTTVYDLTGSPVATINPDGGTTTVVYDTAGHAVATVDPLGYITTTVYDPSGLVLATINALSYATSFVYSGGGQKVATIDALGYRTTTLFDQNNRPTGLIYALGQQTTTVYNSTGAVVAQVDALGHRTTTSYDSAGRTIATINPQGAINTTLYDGFGRPASTLSPRGYRVTSVYDSFGRVVAHQDQLGYRTTSLFDSFGRPAKIQNPMGNNIVSAFDLFNRPIAVTDPLGATTTVIYDPAGRVQARIDALGRRSTTVYDSVGRPLAQVNPLGYATSFSYDLRGGRTALLNARGYRFSSVFDVLARPYVSVDPLGHRMTVSFDQRGAVSQQIDGKGQNENYSYDAIGRQTGIQYADGTRVTRTFDSAVNLLTEANQNGTWTRTYDVVGRRLTEVGPGFPSGLPLTSVYDLAGNRIQLLTWRGIQTWTYDARNFIKTLTDIEGGLTTWTYNGLGLITQQNYPTGAQSPASYDANGRMLQIQHLTSGLGQLDEAIYSYDKVGNPVKIQRYTASNLQELTTYVYDAVNQPLVWNSLQSGWFTYSYDPVGNWKNLIASGGYNTFSYNAADQLINQVTSSPYQGPYVPWFYSTTFSYDPNGNRLTELDGDRGDSGWSNYYTTYVWDPANRLLQVNQSQSGTINQTNTYRPDGLRHRKIDTNGTKQFLWDGTDLLGQVDTTGNLVEFWSRGATLTKGHYPSTQTYPDQYNHLDAQGTVILLSDPNQFTITRNYPGPWGGGNAYADLMWLGNQSYIAESNLGTPLYYVRNRWYVSGGPGWLSPDPVGFGGGDFNLYRYANNRPTVLTDPSGLQGLPSSAPAVGPLGDPTDWCPGSGINPLQAGQWLDSEMQQAPPGIIFIIGTAIFTFVVANWELLVALGLIGLLGYWVYLNNNSTRCQQPATTGGTGSPPPGPTGGGGTGTSNSGSPGPSPGPPFTPPNPWVQPAPDPTKADEIIYRGGINWEGWTRLNNQATNSYNNPNEAVYGISTWADTKAYFGNPDDVVSARRGDLDNAGFVVVDTPWGTIDGTYNAAHRSVTFPHMPLLDPDDVVGYNQGFGRTKKPPKN